MNGREPWLGLESYGEADRDLFYGRERETEELLRMVRRETLTVVFGPSGIGKSSLLRAGLGPRLAEETFLPVFIRMVYLAGSNSASRQICGCVRDSARKRELEEVASGEPQPGESEESIWEYLHRVEFWNKRNQPITPVLCFDQFEEVFTIGQGLTAADAFLTELADLVENYVPAAVRERLEANTVKIPATYSQQPYKIVISMREDFVYRLDGLRRSMPSIMHNRYALSQMDGRQALDAVCKPGHGIVGAEVAEAIVRFAAASHLGESAEGSETGDLENLEVEPALLSVVCRELNARRLRLGEPEITAQQLGRARADILNEFYERSFQGLPSEARVFVEERLLTASGFRNTAPLEDAERSGLGPSMAALEDRRLVRVEQRLGHAHVELTHDLLTKVVEQSREGRRAREQGAAEDQARTAREEGQRKELARARKVQIALVLVAVAFAVALVSVVLDLSAARARNEALQKLEVAQKKTIEEKQRAEEAGRRAVAALAQAQEEERHAKEEALQSRERLASNANTIANLADSYAGVTSPRDAIYARWLKEGSISDAGNHKGALDELNAILKQAPDDLYALSSRGYELLLLGRKDESIADTQKFLKANPRSENALVNLAIAQAMLGRYREALNATRQAIDFYDATNSGLTDSEVAPDIQTVTGHRTLVADNWQFQSAVRFEIAVLEASRGGSGFSNALAEADKHAKDYPESIAPPLLAMNWAWLQYRERPVDYGVLAASGALWERVSSIKPQLKGCAGEAYLRFQQEHAKRRRSEYTGLADWVANRVQHADVAGTCAPPEPSPRELAVQARELQLQAGSDKMKLGQVDRLLTSAIDAVSRDAKQRDFLIYLLMRRAGVRLNAKDTVGVRQDSKQVLSMNKTVSDAYYYLAQTDVDDSSRRKNYEAALHYAPLDPDVLSNYSDFLENSRPPDLPRALSLLLRYLQIRPYSSRAYRRIANIHNRLHQNDAALRSVETAISLAPDSIELYELRSTIENGLGRDETSRALHLAEGYRAVGDASRLQGRDGDALAAYLKGLHTVCDLAPTGASGGDIKFEAELSVRNLSNYLEAKFSKHFAVQFWQNLASGHTLRSCQDRAAAETGRLKVQ